MSKRIVLGVIFGGRSGEHEVSLMSAESVLSVLDTEKYEVVEIGIDHNGKWWSGKNVVNAIRDNNFDQLVPVFLLPEPGKSFLYQRSRNGTAETIRVMATIDVVFPVLHGTFGEDGTLQGFFEMADIAYVGAGVLGSSVGMDKGVFKDVMRANNIPVVDWIMSTRKQIEENVEEVARLAENKLSYPFFIKPANLGSSVGITKAKTHSDLIEGLFYAAQYDRRILIENGVNAREIEVSVLGNDICQTSIPGEVVPSDEFYSYDAKYINGDSDLIIPAKIPAGLSKKIQEMAVRTYQAIDCAGMTRVDFLMDKTTNEIFLNEVNTIPGFTSISMYPKLWEASGLSYPDLIDELISLAFDRKNERNKSKRKFGE